MNKHTTANHPVGGGGTVLTQLSALRPLIESSAAEDENATQIADVVVEALREAGVIGLMAPSVLGGGEAHPDLLIDVISELSYYDGSTGWYAGAVMTAGAVSGACLGEHAVEAIFRGGGSPICAGQAAPNGRAERVDGGYRISGNFSFGSGAPAADWLVGGYMLYENGALAAGPTGDPVMLIAFAPREKVEFLGNWDVLGLRGTGSYDFRVLDQVVHEDFVLNPATPQVRRGGTLYRMGFMGLPTLTHSSFAIGCARRALDEWSAFARSKKRGPATYANELQTFQRDMAMAQAELRAAEAYVRRTYSALFDAAAKGAIDEDLKLDGRLCASHALAVGARVSQTAFNACTTYALRNGGALQRAYRDLQAGAAHFLTSEGSWIDAGRVLAGLPGAAIVF